ncbi:alpha/beta hydrolase [Sulfoacidibacillus ferrooxidans]|uniref:Endo-1,4-beta-xylanase Z n=1 Tax=Sulfoacidibacillus ferrooxidans TaxID=2005001 RepID=A0A9X1V786_9BACL|nr:alpha/beta hydrolase-fold protein [Sulfoacidibacillus ferrooxidans]MCI0182060.1 Endo-1,4-beta-xylanase Z [Sulfoacidibacillus ferrooxidans]
MDAPKRRIVGHTLYSAHLNEERTVKIFLPPNYDEQLTYPILYCHDGNEFFSHGRIATIAADMILTGQLTPCLIVGIAVNHERRTADYSLFGERNDAYIRFVTTECIPYIESLYKVKHDPMYRAMAGISLGAVVTLELSFETTHLFNHMALFSGAYYNEVLTYASRIPTAHATSVFMLVGEQETDVETPGGHHDFLKANRDMKVLLEDMGLDVTYQEAPGTHIWGFWQRHIPEVLHFLDRGWKESST